MTDIPKEAIDAAHLDYYEAIRANKSYGEAMRDALTAALPHLTWWRPISEAPKDETLVLLSDETGAFYLGFFNKRSGVWDDGDFHDDLGAMTHWMPLPAPPETKP